MLQNLDPYDEALAEWKEMGMLTKAEIKFLTETKYTVPKDINKRFYLPENKPEVGIWFYVGFQKGETFEWNVDVMARKFGNGTRCAFSW